MLIFGGFGEPERQVIFRNVDHRAMKLESRWPRLRFAPNGQNPALAVKGVEPCPKTFGVVKQAQFVQAAIRAAHNLVPLGAVLVEMHQESHFAEDRFRKMVLKLRVHVNICRKCLSMASRNIFLLVGFDEVLHPGVAFGQDFHLEVDAPGNQFV